MPNRETANNKMKSSQNESPLGHVRFGCRTLDLTCYAVLPCKPKLLFTEVEMRQWLNLSSIKHSNMKKSDIKDNSTMLNNNKPHVMHDLGENRGN